MRGSKSESTSTMTIFRNRQVLSLATFRAVAVAVLCLAAMLWAAPAGAVSLYWSGTNTWDEGTVPRWSATQGGSPPGTYTDANWVGGSDARFEGTAGVVTLSGTIASVNSISFDTDGYTLGNVVDNGTITLTGAGGNITTGAGLNTINSVIGGGVGLTKLGTGTLTLGGTNTFTGQLTVQNGTLAIGTINSASANGPLGNSELSVILGNAGAQTGTLQYTGATATSTKKFTMATGGTGAFQVDNGATNLTLSGIIDGSGAMNKTGAGTLTLSGSNTGFTGGLSINAGAVSATTSLNALGATASTINLGATSGSDNTILNYGFTGTWIATPINVRAG